MFGISEDESENVQSFKILNTQISEASPHHPQILIDPPNKVGITNSSVTRSSPLYSLNIQSTSHIDPQNKVSITNSSVTRSSPLGMFTKYPINVTQAKVASMKLGLFFYTYTYTIKYGKSPRYTRQEIVT